MRRSTSSSSSSKMVTTSRYYVTSSMPACAATSRSSAKSVPSTWENPVPVPQAVGLLQVGAAHARRW